MSFLKPRRLEAGSNVRILSPSGPITEEPVSEAVNVLQSWGLQVSVDVDAFARDGRYLAGSDRTRRAALQRAIDDGSVDAILFSRGGYGAMRILDGVDWTNLRADPRVVCGFSDITAIHFAVQSLGIATLHGHVAKSIRSQPEDREMLRRTLLGERGTLSLPVTGVCGGHARGPLVGGNLSLIAALAGSDYLPRLEGAVLFIEEVTEEDYRLDRLFTSLRLNRRFSGVAGVVLGHFDECEGTYVGAAAMPAFVRELGAELGEAWGVPVVADFPAGHAERNFPLPLGVDVTVNADAGTVTLDEELVT